MAIVSLPMYWFDETAGPTAVIGQAIADAFAARWEAPAFPDHEALERHWMSPELALSQACGLPLIEALAGKVRAVGTLRWPGVDAAGHCRSVIVSWAPRLPRFVRPAVNSPASLSGWASLGVFLAQNGLEAAPPLFTGSHRASLAAVVRGEADIASIDAVTWALAGRHWPAERLGLTVVGRGPEVPALPLIVPAHASPGAAQAVQATLIVRRVREALSLLAIDGFVPLTNEDYQQVSRWAAIAERSLPRPIPVRPS